MPMIVRCIFAGTIHQVTGTWMVVCFGYLGALSGIAWFASAVDPIL